MVKVYVKTYGCAANQARSEKIKGLLKKDFILSSLEDADVIILNTCSLKEPTEYSMFRLVKESNVPVIIAGCFPLSFPEKPALKNYSIIGTYDFNKIAEAAKTVLGGERVVLLNRTKRFLNNTPLRENKLIAKIEIGVGCLNNCSYCGGKLAHRQLKSRPVEEIISEAEDAINSECKEIWLCSEDNGCYGFDTGTNIVELVRKIIEIPGEFFVRIGMMNPNWVLKLLPDLIEMYKHPKVYKFLHIPVQSGDNTILKSMSRLYSISDFKKIVNTFREEIPELTISTDIIVGLPGENVESFEKTVNLIKEMRPGVLNISRFFPRPGTLAYNMQYMHPKYSKDLSRIIDRIYNKLAVEINSELIGKETAVLFTGIGTKKNQYRGRNIYYKPIVASSKQNLLGKIRRVRIIKVAKDHLLGELI